jgi:non-ribosomal peptide synthetase component E (peptide arylation enzyme)
MADLLTTHAETQPDKVAVVDDRRGTDVRILTYLELEQAANRLVNVLINLGVRSGTKVVWCVNRPAVLSKWRRCSPTSATGPMTSI